ncbi:MAG: hypothetical protein PUA56_01255 [Bacillales bacterium]|nr:hypothetical protein [Bacillales bacterium]
MKKGTKMLLGVALLSTVLFGCDKPVTSDVSSNNSQDTNEVTTEKPTSNVATSEKPTSNVATSEKPTSNVATSEKPTSNVATSEKPTSDVGGGEVIGAPEHFIPHAPGQVTYVFEAECTNLSNKQGPGYSGAAGENGMAALTDDESVGYVSYLYRSGNSVNFLIFSDREVKDAKLDLRCAGEFFNLRLSPENYAIRVDPVNDEDLRSYQDGGALGNWDEFFLNYYSPAGEGEFKGYYIDEWICKTIDINAEGSMGAVGWDTFAITTSLTLYKGVTSISFITDNSDAPLGTMAAVAPVIDNIQITTTAQLGFVDVNKNIPGYNKAPIYIK